MARDMPFSWLIRKSDVQNSDSSWDQNTSGVFPFKPFPRPISMLSASWTGSSFSSSYIFTVRLIYSDCSISSYGCPFFQIDWCVHYNGHWLASSGSADPSAIRTRSWSSAWWKWSIAPFFSRDDSPCTLAPFIETSFSGRPSALIFWPKTSLCGDFPNIIP